MADSSDQMLVALNQIAQFTATLIAQQNTMQAELQAALANGDVAGASVATASLSQLQADLEALSAESQYWTINYLMATVTPGGS